ncbi:MAG: hypothetical protein PHU71_02985 [Candidatus Gracilibacteria bacterium]|nr:hypothetical protein [Candidatus Gracilibacteria bacterium]
MSLKQNTKIISRNHKKELNRLALAVFMFFLLNIAFIANADAASSTSFKLDPEPEHSVSGEYASSSSYAVNDQVTYVAFAPVSSSSNYKVAEGIPSLEVYPVASEEEEEEGGGGGGGSDGGTYTGGETGPSDSVSLGDTSSYSHVSPGQADGEAGESGSAEGEGPTQAPTAVSAGKRVSDICPVGDDICLLEQVALDAEYVELEAETGAAYASATRVQAVASMMFVLFLLLFLLFLLMIYLEKRAENKNKNA